MQIFIESYAIHRTRHIYSESDREAGHKKREKRRGQGMKVSQTEKMTQKGGMTKIVN